MNRIKSVDSMAESRYVSLYNFKIERRDGGTGDYYVASRHKKEDLKALSGDEKPDGVVICSLYGEKKDRLVLVRQFRYPINDYIYEFPAGLVEPGEDYAAAGTREVFEETGLSFTPKTVSGPCCRPFFTTVGLTDENCATIYGYCSGTPTNIHEEATEDIEVVLADRKECRRILKEERVAVMCAYMMMHFIHSKEEDFLSFTDEEFI